MAEKLNAADIVYDNKAHYVFGAPRDAWIEARGHVVLTSRQGDACDEVHGDSGDVYIYGDVDGLESWGKCGYTNFKVWDGARDETASRRIELHGFENQRVSLAGEAAFHVEPQGQRVIFEEVLFDFVPMTECDYQSESIYRISKTDDNTIYREKEQTSGSGEVIVIDLALSDGISVISERHLSAVREQHSSAQTQYKDNIIHLPYVQDEVPPITQAVSILPEPAVACEVVESSDEDMRPGKLAQLFKNCAQWLFDRLPEAEHQYVVADWGEISKAERAVCSGVYRGFNPEPGQKISFLRTQYHLVSTVEEVPDGSVSRVMQSDEMDGQKAVFGKDRLYTVPLDMKVLR